ncbi:unnamed protein product, partial [Symbiodinium sp. CCMP2456]
ALCAWCFLALACGLSVEQRPSVDASSFLAAQVDGSTGKVGASLLEVSDGSMQGRQERVETLLSAEQSALLSQEQALEQIAAQQASLAQQQQELKEREAEVEREISKKVTGLGTSLAQVSEASSSSSGLEVGLQTVKHIIQKTWKEQLISAAVYMAIICAAGWLYGQFCTYEYASLRQEPKISRDSFSFSLIDGCRCDPDHRICLWACCFLPIRWADTASSPKVNFFRYWPGILTMTLLFSLINLSYGVTALLALLLMVANRQRIRSAYNLPHRTFPPELPKCRSSNHQENSGVLHLLNGFLDLVLLSAMRSHAGGNASGIHRQRHGCHRPEHDADGPDEQRFPDGPGHRPACRRRERHRRDTGGIGVALRRADGPLWTEHAEVDPILGDCAPSQDSSAEEEEFPGDLRPPCEESHQARWHEKEQCYQEPWYEDVKESEYDRDWWQWQQPAEDKKWDARAQDNGRDWQTRHFPQQDQKERHQADMAKFASLLNMHNLPREAPSTPATRSSPTKTRLDGQSVEANRKPDARQEPREQPQEIKAEEAQSAAGPTGQKLIVRHKFDGREYGDSYLVLQKGDVLIFLREESEWAFCRRELPGPGPMEGWFPPNFAQKLAQGADAKTMRACWFWCPPSCSVRTTGRVATSNALHGGAKLQRLKYEPTRMHALAIRPTCQLCRHMETTVLDAK